MFYWFYRHLDINLFQYISVRATIGFLLAFSFSIFFLPKFIKWAKKKKASQPIYNLAPKTHQKKTGTPTMGGIVFIFSAILASLLTVKLNNAYVVGGLLTLILFSLIGYIDDIRKITANTNEEGLTPKKKLLYQLGASFIIVITLFIAGLNTDLYIPFYKYPLFDMGFFAILFWVFVLIASSNAVNLTDGLDGLAAVPSIMAIMTLSAIVYIVGHFIIAKYLLLPNIKLAGELSIIGASLVGALIGFLWYNSHPAEVFMGDSGSLAIGAFMGYLAIVAKSEFLLLFVGFIFIIETLSVILQVTSYKYRKKRIFKMAPIHHHFEQLGWNENKVIVRFWIIAFMTNLIALISLKIR